MNEITFNWNSGETTAKSLADLINIVLTEFICDDVIADKFLEVQEHKDYAKFVVYFPTFMIDEYKIDKELNFFANKHTTQFVIENTKEETLNLLNHISDLLGQDDEITIKESSL
ncbi:MAG: hypothetical protein GY734_21890 [Herbaspirillum sp.]|uniref:hypothetical protein n=1 Tax=Herbaspirillum sp. TaxID=1890675 RepID=UPI002585A747|nr:hypothetical protein [Herbaspirillum sp.]MCL4419408.1 hypothetical protein [Patescibacteria group bacterium]MCP3658519.1 hypothetical protein [Herbaspirillum sp.]MCP4033872.1 hypothetical protein [Herbaspirillum sp.]